MSAQGQQGERDEHLKSTARPPIPSVRRWAEFADVGLLGLCTHVGTFGDVRLILATVRVAGLTAEIATRRPDRNRRGHAKAFVALVESVNKSAHTRFWAEFSVQALAMIDS